MNGWALADVVFAVAVVAWCWFHRKSPKVISICFGLAAGLAVFAIPPWRDALARAFGSGPGIVILIIGTFAGLGSYVVTWLRKHHPVWTTALSGFGATCAAMAWAMLPVLGHKAAQLAPKTLAAMGQATNQIRSGHAAAAETPSQSAGIITLALLAFAALIIAAYKHHGASPFPKEKKQRKPAPQPITSGRPAPQPITSGRPAPGPGTGGKQS